MELQGFADDHFFHKMFKPGPSSIELDTMQLLMRTFGNVQDWMTSMRLKLNPDKTEFIVFGGRVQLAKLTTKSLLLNDADIPRSPVVKCLGTHIDKNLKFTHHVNIKCRTAVFNYNKIKSIRKYLTKDTCHTLVLSLVMSHLDYCNSVLVGAPDVLIAKFQRVQNMCAKLVLGKSKYDSSTESLKELHWLPIVLRVKFKIATLVFKCLHGNAPEYLHELLTNKPISSRTLRSNQNLEHQLLVPRIKLKTFAERAFSVKGPQIWNSIPLNIRCADTIDVFSKNLKTYLFQCY